MTSKSKELKDATIKLLDENNPPAICGDGEYFERPNGGWQLSDCYFTGIGYHGNTMVDYNIAWKPAKAGLGHIPSNGYG